MITALISLILHPFILTCLVLVAGAIVTDWWLDRPRKD